MKDLDGPLGVSEADVRKAIDAALWPEWPDEGVYDGEEAYTAPMLAARYNVTETTARDRARKATARGELVVVKVRSGGGKSSRALVEAWVPTAIYEQWRQHNDKSNDE